MNAIMVKHYNYNAPKSALNCLPKEKAEWFAPKPPENFRYRWQYLSIGTTVRQEAKFLLLPKLIRGQTKNSSASRYSKTKHIPPKFQSFFLSPLKVPLPAKKISLHLQ
jgi:hypothetical protein